MRVYAAELICSTGVLGFRTFTLALCIHNKLRSHAEILSWWAFDVTSPGSNPLRSTRSGLNVSNGGSWNLKLTLKVNSLWIKMKGHNFASQVLSRHTFRISRKKGSDFFGHRGTLKYWERRCKHSKPPPLLPAIRCQNTKQACALARTHVTTTLNVIGWFKLWLWMWLAYWTFR